MTRVNDNILYVATEGAFVHRVGETVCVRIGDERRLQVPWSQLAGVAVFGQTYVTPALMAGLLKAGVWLSYFSGEGRFVGRLTGPPSGNIVLRNAQFQTSHDESFCVSLTRSIVLGKLANQRRFLRRLARETKNSAAKQVLSASAEAVARAGKTAATKRNVEQIRGYEGAGAQSYFSAFGSAVRVDAAWARFGKRSRRPPLNAVNALLSFGYALLCADCTGALASVGLDPGRGYLHALRSGRPALALDLMEEFRVAFVDRVVISALNRGQLKQRDFKTDAGGATSLTDDGRKRFISAYQEAKMARLTHPFLKQETRYSRLPVQQARILARTIRGDIPAYPPFALEG